MMTRPPEVRKIAAAVSGGCDSVAMLLLLREWCRMRHIKLYVFHVDHSLRSVSGEDSLWVKNLATRLGLEFFMRKACPGSFSSDHKVGSEAWAREFRYNSFIEMLDESGADIVATGHNADDQAETVLMRLMRGCSWQGLGGINSRIRLKLNGRELRVWRPLLNVARIELERLLLDSGQSWREDETNQTLQYSRNRVRHQLLPLMNELQGGSTRHIVALSADARQLQHRLARQARAFIKKFATGSELKVYITPECTLRREIIRRWLCVDDRSLRVDRTLISRVDQLWRKKCLVDRVVYKEFCVKRLSDRLIVEENLTGYSACESENSVPTDCAGRDFKALLQKDQRVEVNGWKFSLDKPAGDLGNNASFFFIPAEYAHDLQIRFRQPGDRFYPAGGNGGKKLARWLIDQKIPVGLRDLLPLVASTNNVLLVAGYVHSRFLKLEPGPDGLWLKVVSPEEIISGKT